MAWKASEGAEWEERREELVFESILSTCCPLVSSSCSPCSPPGSCGS